MAQDYDSPRNKDEDEVTVDQDGTSVQPAFGGQDTPVDDLCQHKRLIY